MINNFNIDDFLRNYWQKKPLLIRAAFPNYHSPITAEELAGLACEEFVESRIICEQTSNPKWSLETGPFTESRFTTLEKTHWTLLIQGLNKIFPEFDDLLHEFNFIPSWRVDDLMASYAAPEGSVGPHVDQYDVFLLQATGRRKWMISEKPVSENNFEENLATKIIKNFKAENEWILETGDMLYLPANVAHYGTAMEDCMTFSIGFRAPSHAELLTAYIDDNITDIDDSLRYKDPCLIKNKNHGEISADAINNIQQIFLSQFSDKDKLADWFGQFITDYLNDGLEQIENTISTEQFIDDFKRNNILRRAAHVRANFIVKQKELNLYINGVKQKVQTKTKYMVKLFCNENIYYYSDLQEHLSEESIKFLCELYNKGYLEFSGE